MLEKKSVKTMLFLGDILVLILFIYTHKIMLICNIHFFKNATSSASFTYLVCLHLYPKEEENGSQFKKAFEYVLKL